MARPFINLMIPSVLDSIAWWYTLRETQRQASGKPNKHLYVTSYQDTYVRHIDLLEKVIFDRPVVQDSFVNGMGQPILGDSDISSHLSARIAIA